VKVRALTAIRFYCGQAITENCNMAGLTPLFDYPQNAIAKHRLVTIPSRRPHLLLVELRVPQCALGKGLKRERRRLWHNPLGFSSAVVPIINLANPFREFPVCCPVPRASPQRLPLKSPTGICGRIAKQGR
jgi:hypothetical protein